MGVQLFRLGDYNTRSVEIQQYHFITHAFHLRQPHSQGFSFPSQFVKVFSARETTTSFQTGCSCRLICFPSRQIFRSWIEDYQLHNCFINSILIYFYIFYYIKVGGTKIRRCIRQDTGAGLGTRLRISSLAVWVLWNVLYYVCFFAPGRQMWWGKYFLGWSTPAIFHVSHLPIQSSPVVFVNRQFPAAELPYNIYLFVCDLRPLINVLLIGSNRFSR